MLEDDEKKENGKFPRFICINRNCEMFGKTDEDVRIFRKVEKVAKGINIYDSRGFYLEQKENDSVFEEEEFEGEETFCYECDCTVLDTLGMPDNEVVARLL